MKRNILPRVLTEETQQIFQRIFNKIPKFRQFKNTYQVFESLAKINGYDGLMQCWLVITITQRNFAALFQQSDFTNLLSVRS